MVKYIFTAICLFFLVDAFAQEADKSIGVGVTQHFGFISPHNVLVNEVVKGHTNATELSLYNQTNGKKTFEQFYNYPKVGVSALFLNTGNPESLGNAFGIFPFIDFPLNHWKITWNLKFGYGIGYIQKPFDRKDNYKNLVIGSNLNALIFMNSHWVFPLSEKLNLSAGVSFTHFSNGSLKRPNLGLNIFAGNFGVSYQFNKVVKYIPETPPIRERDFKHLVLATFGLKEIDPIGGRKYEIYNLSYNIIKVVSDKSSVGLGLDFSYNSSLETLTKRLQNEDHGKISNFNMGISGLYSLDIGKISLMLHAGTYIYRIYKVDNAIYSRIVTRYQVNDKLFFNLSLKTHFFVADFIEYGVGYRLN